MCSSLTCLFAVVPTPVPLLCVFWTSRTIKHVSSDQVMQLVKWNFSWTVHASDLLYYYVACMNMMANSSSPIVSCLLLGSSQLGTTEGAERLRGDSWPNCLTGLGQSHFRARISFLSCWSSLLLASLTLINLSVTCAEPCCKYFPGLSLFQSSQYPMN